MILYSIAPTLPTPIYLLDSVSYSTNAYLVLILLVEILGTLGGAVNTGVSSGL